MEEKKNSKFIGESISVGYNKEPLLKRVPGCPDNIIWRKNKYIVTALISQWSNMARRGDKSKNMRPSHLIRAEKMGSWGVGRFYFRISVEGGQIFDIYYDRAPKKELDGDGQWILLCERFLTAGST